MDQKDMARLGGLARMKKLNKQARIDLATKAVRARWAKSKLETGKEGLNSGSDSKNPGIKSNPDE